MDAIPVKAVISPEKQNGTVLWASDEVLSLLSGDAGGLDKTQRGLLVKRLRRYCDGIATGA